LPDPNFLPLLFRLEDRALLLDELGDDEELEGELGEGLEEEGLEGDELEDELDVLELEDEPDVVDLDSDGGGIGGVITDLLPDPPVGRVELRPRLEGIPLSSDPFPPLD